jgi:hypothetical protein
MNKILLPIILSLMSFGFLSCIDESAPTAVAAVDSTSAAEVFGGYTLDLNPTIVFSADGKTGTYDNSANDSGFPAGTNIQVAIAYTNGGVGLDITFTADAFTEGALGVTVQDFKDTGNDGGIDEFTVSAAKVGDKPIPNFKPVVKRPMPGEMKRSKADLAANPVASTADAAVAQKEVDISGTPTLAEWNSNIVGKGFLITHADGDLDLLSFTSASAGVIYEFFDNTNDDFTYTFEPLVGESQGILKATYPWTASNGDKMRADLDITLKFTDWYNGTYKDEEIKDTNLATNQVTYDQNLSTGTFSIVKDVNVYVQSKSTASAGATTGN